MELMKAVLTDARFSDPDWIFERKLDGIRCVATIADGKVDLRTRNDKSLNERFATIRAALEQDAIEQAVLDGEVVAPDGRFASLQQGAGNLLYYVFDILELDGADLTERPWRERKATLMKALAFEDPIRLTTHRNEHGERFFREACEKGWEGLIAKRADSTYVRGRSKDWLKFKCGFEQELVIGGYTAPTGSRQHFGALLVGYYDGDDLRYAGKVGTGFTRASLADIHAQLTRLERKTSPFADAVKERATWVTPELVGQVGFSEWTRDGRLRHPRFLGMRDDKAARDVVRE